MTFLTQRELPHSREDCPVCPPLWWKIKGG